MTTPQQARQDARRARRIQRARLAADETIYLEEWASPPAVPATCPAGALAGTGYETWTMAGGYDGYPYLNPNAVPPQVFRLYDPADPSEIIRVDATPAGNPGLGTAGPVWDVARATEGTPGRPHLPGFEVRPFLTKAGMDGIAAGTPSHTGLVGPTATADAPPRLLTAPVVLSGNARHNVAPLNVPGGEAVPGSVYELLAWGFFTVGPLGSSTPEQVYPHFACAVVWSPPGNPGQLSFPFAGAAPGQANHRWRVHISVNALTAVSLASTITLWVASSNTAADAVRSVQIFGTPGAFAFNPSAAAVFALRVDTGTGGSTVDPGPTQVTVQGARSWRAA
jgi:hypothetical protein